MAKTLHVKKGDQVKINTGKDRGKEGEVIQVFPAEERVIVDGVNMVKKHQAPSNEMMQGGIIDQAAPVHVSNVTLICPNCDEPSRTGRRRLEDGTKVRVCKKCDEIVD